MSRKLVFTSGGGLIVACLLVAVGYLYREVADISRFSEGPPKHSSSSADEPTNFHFIGVVSRFAPAVTYETYQPLIDYLNRSTPYHFRLRLGRSYEETVDQLASQEVVAAFLGSYLFAQVRGELPIQPLLRPLNPAGQPMTRSTLIARAGGPVKTVADLEGRTLALPSPSSFSGNWLTRMALREHGLGVKDLGELEFFDYHHTVVFQVLWGRFDAGVVRESVALEYLDQGIEVLSSSPAFSGAPLVIHQEADPKLVEELKRAFLEMPTSSPEGLRREFANGFVEAKHKDYDLLEAWGDQMDEEHG